MEIKELIKQSHENAVKHGFWEDWNKLQEEMFTIECPELVYANNSAIGNMLMLIVSEVAEAQEGLRHGDRDNFREELADVAIRLADLCGGLDIDLEAEIQKKMEINKNRPYKHNKEF
jgi:NTP pyrophosphatase (non-canonical NTP hydrolase)